MKDIPIGNVEVNVRQNDEQNSGRHFQVIIRMIRS